MSKGFKLRDITKTLSTEKVTEKRCERCKAAKPAKEFRKRPHNHSGDGLNKYCRKCEADMQAERKAAKAEENRLYGI